MPERPYNPDKKPHRVIRVTPELEALAHAAEQILAGKTQAIRGVT